MISAPLPPDEELRLAALQEYQVLDTAPELAYDDIVFLASQICGTPIAAISLIDRNRQWFKAKVGLDAEETPRDIAFCAHAILDKGQPFVVEDARLDERFADNPLVTGDLSIRFYAGAPLVASNGHALGTLCVIDQEPRGLTDEARHGLEILSREVVSQLELRRTLRELDRTRIQQLEQKDRLLSHVSHELRSPLTVISQFVSILLDGLGGALAPVQREYLEIVDRNANQLRLMIGDLIEVSRLKTGKFGLERTAMELHRIVAEVVQSLQISAGSRGIELSSVIEPELPLVHADPVRVKQILTNLIENALKFTPEGGTIAVRAALSADADGMVQVSVRDSGHGIAAEERDSIFEELYQVEDEHPEARRGLGLGLHICKDLVSMHGGAIWVDSTPGRGATFHFTLPAIQLREWIAGFLSSHHVREGQLSLLSIGCTPPTDQHGAAVTEDFIDRTRLTLQEHLPNNDLLLPRSRWTGSGLMLFVLVDSDAAAARALGQRVRKWLHPMQDQLTDALTVNIAIHPLALRTAHDIDPCRAAADAAVRMIDEVLTGLERRGAA